MIINAITISNDPITSLGRKVQVTDLGKETNDINGVSVLLVTCHVKFLSGGNDITATRIPPYDITIGNSDANPVSSVTGLPVANFQVVGAIGAYEYLKTAIRNGGNIVTLFTAMVTEADTLKQFDI